MANPYYRWLHRAMYSALALTAAVLAVHADRSRVGHQPELDAVILYAVYYLLPYCLISLTCDLGVDAKGAGALSILLLSPVAYALALLGLTYDLTQEPPFSIRLGLLAAFGAQLLNGFLVVVAIFAYLLSRGE